MKGHKKKGKKYTPKLMADGRLRNSEWSVERLPELFVLGWALDVFGTKKAFELFLDFGSAFQAVLARERNSDYRVRAYNMSEHLGLTDKEKETLCHEFSGDEWYESLIPEIRELSHVWPTLPVAYLASKQPDEKFDLEEFVPKLKNWLIRVNHRHEKLALQMQATVFMLELQSGNLSMPKELFKKMPDLSEIERYPDTEESRSAAGFVVSSYSSMFSMMHLTGMVKDMVWQRDFWNACYRLEECKYEWPNE